MKLIPLSRASLTIRVVSSWPRLPMFILPPNCIVPSATSLTMSPVFPNLRYFIVHSPSAANKNCDTKARIHPIHSAHSRMSSSRATRQAIAAQPLGEPVATWIVMLLLQPIGRESCEVLCHKFPIRQLVDHRVDMISALVLIIEIVRMFPDIDRQQRFQAVR